MTAPSAVRGKLLVLAYFAFISLGLPDGLIGVGWPSIRADLGVPTEALGLLLFASTAGYLISSVAAGFTLARLGVGWLLAGSATLATTALAGYAVSPLLAVMIGFALLAGFAGGAIDSGLNAYAASAFGPKHMNWLHAFFGLGVALGPLIMTAVIMSGASWRWGYALIACAQLLLALIFVRTAQSWGEQRAVPGSGDPHHAPVEAMLPPLGRETLVLPAVWFGVLTFATYVAIEVGAGLWAFVFLTEGRGLSAAAAGACMSGYWASLFLGRIVQGLVAERLGTRRVLVGSLVGMAGGALLVAIPAPAGLAVTGLALIGFAAAPVFPLLTLTTADRVGAAHADRAIGMQVAAAALGGAVIPAGIGVLLSRIDVEALGPALLLLAVSLLAFYAASNRPGNSPTNGVTGNAHRGSRLATEPGPREGQRTPGPFSLRHAAKRGGSGA
jgi:fucose permease